MSKQVFISYPRDNAAGQALARSLYYDLQKQQISVFLDEHSIEPGDRWLNTLKKGLASCKVMLSVVSAASDDRAWFEKEFNEAQKHDVRIIPVLAEAVDIPMQLSDVQAVALYGDEANTQRDKLFAFIRKYLGIDVVAPLIKDANQAKRQQAYDTAIEKWREVLQLTPEYQRASEEIERLKALSERKKQGEALSGQLATRYLEIEAVFADIAAILKHAEKHSEAESLITLSQQFLDNTLNTEDYIRASLEICEPKTKPTHSLQSADYPMLADRICRGEIVLFLGTEIAREYGREAQSERQLAEILAEQTHYKEFDADLSSIAEYLRLTPGCGSSGLQSRLENVLQQSQPNTRLYTLLAQIKAPLVLISASYDDQLERQFQSAKKRYVQLSSIISGSDKYGIGHVVASFSDGSRPDQSYLAEELSALKLHEEDYSIIYKIRGSCMSSAKQSEQDRALQRDALTVSESDYFTFAQHAEQIIPSYLTSLLRGRGFLFFGFSPANWEQRLLVSALLSKRTHASDECFTVGVSHDPLEEAYWFKRRVGHYDLNLPELDEHLEEVLL